MENLQGKLVCPYPRCKQAGAPGYRNMGYYEIFPLRVQVCLRISSGLRPLEHLVPAIHPTSKLVGILEMK